MSRIRHALLLMSLAGLGGLSACPASGPQMSGVACVIDGREVAIGGVRAGPECRGGTRLRLHGLAAPTGQEPHAPVAAAALIALADGQPLACVDRGGGGARCALPDGTDLGAELVRRGGALACRGESQDYLDAEREAADGQRGLAALDWRPAGPCRG